MEHTSLNDLINAHRLPSSFIDTVDRWYRPVTQDIAALHEGKPLVLGVQGTQGSGKSTLADFFCFLLQHEHGLRTVSLSIDDFYLTHAERQSLAAQVHPLLKTRGVPGTHDVELAQQTIQKLKQLGAGHHCHIPRFNKAVDDRKPTDEWDSIEGPVDVIIFEGWCVGATPQPEALLATPINALEAQEDPDAHWRHYVNKALAGPYQQLYSLLDKRIVITAPSFECVFEWRWLQERKLVERWNETHPNDSARLLDEEAVRRFISHYERLTRHCLDTLPAQADWVLALKEDHSIYSLTPLNEAQSPS